MSERLRGNMNGEIVQNSVHPMQQEVARFQEYIGTPRESVFKKFKEEAVEAVVEHDKSGFSKEFQIELTDTIIVALGLIHLSGGNFEDLFQEKMQINWNKYRLMPFYMAQGDSYELAAERVKELYNSTRADNSSSQSAKI